MNNNSSVVSKFDLAHLFAAFRRGLKRLWLPSILLIVLLSGIMGFRAWRSYRPVYTASATFTVYVGSSLQSTTPTYNAAAAQQLANTFPYILTSGVLSEVVKSDLQLQALPAINASAVTDANLFELSVTGGDPQLCYDVLQSVIKNYPSVAEFVIGPTVLNIVDETGVPSKPNNSRNWRAPAERGAMIGVVISLAAIFLYGMAKATVLGREDMEERSNARYLGALPCVNFKRRSGDAPVITVLEGGDRTFREAFRLIVMRVRQHLKNHRRKVVLVTSAIPGEGKTTVSFNLALSLTEQGNRVILVDCDLRNPSVYRMTGHDECEGLGEYLCGDLPLGRLGDAIHSVEGTERIKILYAGKPGAASPELLSGEDFAKLISLLREVYDYVVLDTPPCSLLSDVSELQGVADCAILVVRQNFASKSSVLNTLMMLDEYEIPVAGYIMNVFEGRIGSGQGYGYGSGYGYGYGSGYGYGYGSGYGKEYGKYGSYGSEEKSKTEKPSKESRSRKNNGGSPP